MIKKTIVFLFFTFSINSVFADSPLTSIDFWTIHSENFDIQKAFKNKKMDKSAIDFILNENNSLEFRLSMINAIGWKFNSDNKKSTALLKSILKKYKANSIDDLFSVNNINILTCYTYSLAMDNYKNVENIVQLASKVSNLDSNNFYSNYTFSLIKSQKYSLSFEWCNVHLVFKEIRNTDYFKSEFGKKLFVKTFDYIDLYDSYCAVGSYDYYIDLSNEIRFFNLEKNHNTLFVHIYPVLYRDGKIEIYSDNGELQNSIPFESADYKILDISIYNYPQFNIIFTDIDNKSVTIKIKKQI